jgi:HSP20 family molecular chaperone IbpA
LSLTGYETETLDALAVSHWIEEFFNTSIFSFSTPLPEVVVRESEEAYTMEVHLPGLAEGCVDVRVDDDVLTISSRNTSVSFRRSFVLPKDVEREKTAIDIQDCVLTMCFAKISEELPQTEVLENRTDCLAAFSA